LFCNLDQNKHALENQLFFLKEKKKKKKKNKRKKNNVFIFYACLLLRVVSFICTCYTCIFLYLSHVWRLSLSSRLKKNVDIVSSSYSFFLKKRRRRNKNFSGVFVILNKI